MSAAPLLPWLTPAEVLARARLRTHGTLDDDTRAVAARILEDVRARGVVALREHARRLGDLPPLDSTAGQPLLIGQPQLAAAFEQLPPAEQSLLTTAARRIEQFALAQRRAFAEFELPVPGGVMGQTVAPVARAGCYAPGGRYPLPSSVLMTALTARAAGVPEIIVASPRPTELTLAAAAVAGATAVLPIGGAQAIAALAYGAGELEPCDAIAGPGNRYVTAAKQLVAGHVAIDMLAGPSELLILADDSADPRLIAADLLAQAEHDDDAVPMLIVSSAGLAEAVTRELLEQLRDLPTAATARRALRNGWVTLADFPAQAVTLADAIAPEHLQVMTRAAPELAARLGHYGALFVGAGAAEVFGDYGLGPNHVLPTGGAARHTGGLSVGVFLRVRTFIRITATHPAPELCRETAAFARLEGLEGHARAAELRLRAP